MLNFLQKWVELEVRAGNFSPPYSMQKGLLRLGSGPFSFDGNFR